MNHSEAAAQAPARASRAGLSGRAARTSAAGRRSLTSLRDAAGKAAALLLAAGLTAGLFGCGRLSPTGASGVACAPQASSLRTSSGTEPASAAGAFSAGSAGSSGGLSVSLANSSAGSSGTAVSAGEKVAYLSFDDGPTEFTPKFLAVLKKYDVKATFFIAFMGKDSAQKRAWIRQEAADGHALGVHSWTHDYPFIYSSETNFLKDFGTMRRVIRSATGVDPKICRFPGGTGNTTSLTHHGGVAIMPTLAADVQKMGYKEFDWTAGGQDAQLPLPKTGAQFANEILAEIGSQKQPVILMHDRRQVTLDALPILIEQLKAKGYRFAVLSPSGPDVMQKPARSRVSSPPKKTVSVSVKSSPASAAKSSVPPAAAGHAPSAGASASKGPAASGNKPASQK